MNQPVLSATEGATALDMNVALDETNVGYYNKVLDALSDRFQFIVITHRRKTMEVLDTLYGVTMQEPGVSKLVGVDLAKELPSHLKKSFKELPDKQVRTAPQKDGCGETLDEQDPSHSLASAASCKGRNPAIDVRLPHHAQKHRTPGIPGTYPVAPCTQTRRRATRAPDKHPGRSCFESCCSTARRVSPELCQQRQSASRGSSTEYPVQ